jgi:hypothetical protein
MAMVLLAALQCAMIAAVAAAPVTFKDSMEMAKQKLQL